MIIVVELCRDDAERRRRFPIRLRKDTAQHCRVILEGGVNSKYCECVRCVRSDTGPLESFERWLSDFYHGLADMLWLAVCRVVVLLLDVVVRP